MMYKKCLKRVFDLVFAFVLILTLLPIFLFVTVFLTFATKDKPFYLQLRPGKYGKLFRIIKFKTMSDLKGLDGELLPDAERLTKIGKFIRKCSLDEIPQLLNVILGDMSLIGPRPLLVEYLPLYNKEQERRHEVKPGITGWAQVNGRNAISWEEKFKLDVWYVDNISLKIDIKIFFMTIKKIFKKEGISSQTSVTMEKFRG